MKLDSAIRDQVLATVPSLRAFAISLCGNIDRADDLVQDIFAKVVDAIEKFELDKERGRFRGWLKTIAIHALVDRRRSLRLSPLDTGQEPVVEDPLERIWDEEYHQHVLTVALQRVRQESELRTWQCFAECKLNGRRAAEVAARLGMKVAAVFVAGASFTVLLAGAFLPGVSPSVSSRPRRLHTWVVPSAVRLCQKRSRRAAVSARRLGGRAAFGR